MGLSAAYICGENDNNDMKKGVCDGIFQLVFLLHAEALLII